MCRSVPRPTALVAALACLGLAFVSQSSGQTRRALLIGINQYGPETEDAGTLRKWKNLDGAVNDVQAIESILQSAAGFDEILTLQDSAATRARILSSIQSFLVDRSEPGDVALFFYAGHGSQVKNEASTEADGLDETIVPADAWKGASDIRDKELRDYFNTLIDRGALVTLIFDSCHSGSITRGIPGGKSRQLEPSDLVISDPSDPPKPVDRGALILSAAQDDETARELVDEDGFARGAFSWALANALRNSAGDQSATELFLRVRALLRSRGITQEPVLAGLPERKMGQLFVGGGDALDAGVRIAVEEVKGAEHIVLQGGLAMGLRPGATLASARDGAATTEVTIREAIGMSRSVAELSSGGSVPEPGEVFEVTRWVSASAAPLRLHVPPPGPDFDGLVDFASDVQSLAIAGGLRLITDPTEEPASHVLAWRGSSWSLSLPGGDSIDLGARPAAEDLAAAVAGKLPAAAIWMNLPPFSGFHEELHAAIDAGDRPTELVTEPGNADYILAGAAEDGRLSFAWMLREATVHQSASATPPRTDWRAATEERLSAAALLASDLAKLDVVWGWLNLESPPDDGTFPYRFVGLENVSTGEIHTDGDTLRAGELFRAVLRTTGPDLDRARVEAMMQNVEKRFVYIFALDQYGQGVLLYPSARHGSVENDVSLFSDLPLEIRYGIHGDEKYLFGTVCPCGVDSFFLLTSAEPLPQPEILNFAGVRTRSGTSQANQTPLARLLTGIGTATRGKPQPVPTSWSITRMSVRSLPPE